MLYAAIVSVSLGNRNIERPRPVRPCRRKLPLRRPENVFWTGSIYGWLIWISFPVWSHRFFISRSISAASMSSLRGFSSISLLKSVSKLFLVFLKFLRLVRKICLGLNDFVILQKKYNFCFLETVLFCLRWLITLTGMNSITSYSAFHDMTSSGCDRISVIFPLGGWLVFSPSASQSRHFVGSTCFFWTLLLPSESDLLRDHKLLSGFSIFNQSLPDSGILFRYSLSFQIFNELSIFWMICIIMGVALMIILVFFSTVDSSLIWAVPFPLCVLFQYLPQAIRLFSNKLLVFQYNTSCIFRRIMIRSK